MRTCTYCGAEFTPLWPDRSNRPPQRFCSRQCRLRDLNTPERNKRIAVDTAEARGDLLRGRGEGKGYRKRGGRYEHRVVAEETLGRPLAPGEIVHHIDGDKLNNDPANLAVMTQADHIRIHLHEGDKSCRA